AHVGRLVGAPEADEVRSDRAVAVRHERRDDVSPQIRRRRLAVQQQDRRPLALVDDVHAQAVDVEHDARLLQVEQILVERERRLADATDDFLFAEPAAARRQRQPDGALPADVHHEVVLDALGDLAPAGRTSGALYCRAHVAYARALLAMHHAQTDSI